MPAFHRVHHLIISILIIGGAWRSLGTIKNARRIPDATYHSSSIHYFYKAKGIIPVNHCSPISPTELFSSSGENGEIRIVQYRPFRGKVNINIASAELLSILPGLSDKAAQRIVTHRIINGPFRDVSDLRSADLISEKSFHTILPLISTDPL